MSNCNFDCDYVRTLNVTVIRERDEARADLQNLRNILLSQIPLTKEPGTNVELLRQIVQQRDSARAKAIQFDLDHAGIEQRAAEAVELVDLRAEVERLRAELEGEWLTRSKRLEEDGAKLLAGLAASSLARRREVAEAQRDADIKAFAAWLREVKATGNHPPRSFSLADAVDIGEFCVPLVTEVES